jgi:hypothetical protein
VQHSIRVLIRLDQSRAFPGGAYFPDFSQWNFAAALSSVCLPSVLCQDTKDLRSSQPGYSEMPTSNMVTLAYLQQESYQVSPEHPLLLLPGFHPLASCSLATIPTAEFPVPVSIVLSKVFLFVL